MTLVSTAAKASSSGSGSLTLLSTTTLGADGTIDVQNIANTYNDLILIGSVRCSAALTADQLFLRLNNDSGANYDYELSFAAGGSPQSSEGLAQAQLWLGNVVSSTAPASIFDFTEVVIPGYAGTSVNKEIRGRSNQKAGTTTGLVRVFETAGFWRSSAAITRVTLFGGTAANLLTGSSLRIYGRL